MTDRRLIEDSMPLAEISEYSAKEKSIRHGHISTLHLWWARRPLAAARAATMAALLPAPKSEAQREHFHRLITDSLDWNHIRTPQSFADRLRADLGGHWPSRPPRVLDPFSGGGALPLEAGRLGAEAYASDLNPVAHLVEIGTLNLPQRFAHLKSDLSPQDSLVGKTRLVAEIERWGAEIQQRVERDLGALYRTDDGRQSLFYVWARTVVCANPSCRARVPLSGSWYLVKKTKYVHALRPLVDAGSNEIRFELVEDPTDYDPGEATVRGGKVTCPVCEQTFASSHTKKEGKAGRLGHRMLAVAISVDGKRVFRLPTDREASVLDDIDLAKLDSVNGFPAVPDEPLPPPKTLGFRVQPYGFKTWGDIYNARQIVAMTTIARHVAALGPEIEKGVADLGDDAPDFARAVATFLGLCASRLSGFMSTIAILKYAGGRGVNHTFRLQALPMTWDYAESNPLNTVAASWTKSLADMLRAIANLEFSGAVDVRRCSADRLPFEDGFFDAVITDPPYYDAVPYSDLSDYYYVWLKRCLRQYYPDALATSVTPKRAEIVENPAHDKSSEFFDQAMGRAFAEMHRVLNATGIAVVVFAHKTTAAWEKLLQALLENGLVISASWPVETEQPSRSRARDSAALASSVFIVCRKRTAHHDGFLDDVEPELTSRLHERLDYFWSQGIRGADFFMSAIGPAVEVFGRYKRVLKLSGEEVTIGELLDKVRAVVADYALQRIVHGASAGDVDEASRFYVIWRWAFGTSEVESGEAIHMAQSMGCEFNDLVADKGVLNKKGDKVSLKGPLDRKKVKGLGEPAATGTLAPLIDVLHRAANLWAAGERQELADFLAEALRPGGVDRMQRLGQSIVDVLVPGDKERALYENFLVGARSLPSPTKKDEMTIKQQKLF